MVIEFDIAGTPAQFRWSSFNGTTELISEGRNLLLQSPWAPSAHFGLSTEQWWECVSKGHVVRVLKRRPVFFAGFRNNYFAVSVDGILVAEAIGR